MEPSPKLHLHQFHFGTPLLTHLSPIANVTRRSHACCMVLFLFFPSTLISAIFVFWNLLFRKLFFKFFYVCLPLEKLVNRKYFPVNEKHFPVNGKTFRSTENTFQSKKNLVWFLGKCFPFWLCLFSGKWFPGNHFPNFPMFVCH
jgi:hypothetical protein